MLGSLLLFPLRLGVRAAEVTLHAAADVLERIAGLAGANVDPPPEPEAPGPRATGSEAPGPRATGPYRDARAPDPRSAASPTPPATPEPPTPTQLADETLAVEPVDRGEPIDYDAPAPVEPAHVDVEVELVEEVAEPGAQDGAGASVRVAEPWEGYRELRAADVADRLGSASREELAAIELYELSHRNRRTVIAAAQRELRRR